MSESPIAEEPEPAEPPPVDRTTELLAAVGPNVADITARLELSALSTAEARDAAELLRHACAQMPSLREEALRLHLLEVDLHRERRELAAVPGLPRR
jgi:hypothetical protein